MKSAVRKSLGVLLTLAMLLSGFTGLAVPASAVFLEESGQLGDDVYYTYDAGTGAVSITGTGGMWTFYDSEDGYTSPFHGKSMIRSVTIGEGVTDVTEAMFWYCEELSSVTLPEGLTAIGADAFSYTDIRELTLPASLREIGVHAFHCSNLTSIVIPDGVTDLGVGAFTGCEYLTTAAIPGSVRAIRGICFNECPLLKKVYIGKGLESFGPKAFYYSDSLTDVYYAGSAADWAAVSIDPTGNDALRNATVHYNYQREGNIVWRYDETADTLYIGGSGDMEAYYDPDELPWYAYKDSVKAVVIEPGVTSVGENAFYNFPALKTVSVSGSVTAIGDLAFAYCYALESVTIMEGVQRIGIQAFYACFSLNTVTIPRTVTDIGDSAFEGCPALETIFFTGSEAQWNAIPKGDGWLSIYDPSAFTSRDRTPEEMPGILYHCQQDGGTFWCYDETAAALHIGGYGGMKDYTAGGTPWNAYKTGATAAVIHPGVTSAGAFALSDFTALKSVTLPDSVTRIGSHALYACPALEAICFTGGEAQWNAVTKGDLWLGLYDEAALAERDRTAEEMPLIFFNYHVKGDVFWHYNETTKTLTVGGSGAIGDYTYDDRPAWYYGEYTNDFIEHLIIEEGITTIGKNAFSYFSALKTATVPATVESIGESAFSQCTALKTAALSAGLNRIGNYAFYHCESLENITVPAGVGEIGLGAFYYCTSLQTVTLPDSVTSMGNSVFSNCTSLQTVTLPNSLTSIGSGMFRNCTSLETITFPNNLTGIGQSAFSWCSSLSDVRIPDSVTWIGKEAFSNCTSLKMLTLSGGLRSVPIQLCIDCASLETVTIPVSATQLEEGAFLNCPALKTVNYTGSEAQWDAVTQKTLAWGFYDYDTETPTDRTEEDMPAFVFYYGVEGAMNAVNDIGTVEYTDECKARIDAARAAYDALSAADRDDVTNSATLTAAEDAYAALLAAALLAAAKADAKAELAAYKNADDYRPAEQADLAAVITSFNIRIDAAEDIDAVAAALADGKAALDIIKTDAQLSAEELAADKAAFEEYREAVNALADGMKLEGDSDACIALIGAAKEAVDAVVYDESKTLDENKEALDAAAALTQLAADLADQRAAEADDPREAFEAYRVTLLTLAQALRKEGDSAAVTALIDEAVAALTGFAYDGAKPLAENEDALSEVLALFANRVKSQRRAERQAELNKQPCSLCGEHHTGSLLENFIGVIHGMIWILRSIVLIAA